MQKERNMYIPTLTEEQELLGAAMNVNTNPEEQAHMILADMKKKREALGWK